MTASGTILERLTVYLNFTWDSEDLSCRYKRISDFYEPWQQHKQLKTIEINKAWCDIYDEGYIRQFETLHKKTDQEDQMIKKTIPMSTKTIVSCAMKNEFEGKSMETETTTWSKFAHVGKVTVEQILGSGEIIKLKRAELRESQSKFRAGKLTIWVMKFEIITGFTRSNSFTRVKLTKPYDRC